MELCKEYKSLCFNESREKIRESVELDFQENLPQYLDDIEKIIRCSVNSTVTDYDFHNSSITVYGKSIISITYKSGDSCILSNIFEEEFSKSFELNNCESFCFAKIKLKTKYNNIHLINQRRIDVHTALSVCIEAFCSNSEEYLCTCKNAFFKSYNAECLSCKSSGIAGIDFDENISVIENDTQIKNIINCFADCRIDDKKIIKDKMLVKGTVSVCFVYECMNGEIQKTATAFTVSKIIEATNLDENDTAFVFASISNAFVKAKADESNNLKIIEFAGKATVDYQIYSTENLQVNIDSYVPHYKTNTQLKSLNIKENPQLFYDDKTLELDFDCDGELVEIIDLQAKITNQEIVDSCLKLELCLSFIYYDDKSNICFCEKKKETQIRLADSKLSGSCNTSLLSYDYVIKNGGRIALRANLEYQAFLFTDSKINFITDVDMSDEISSVNSPQLTLYFADKEEDTWEIAKKFSTSAQLIIDENGLSSDIVDSKRILLIPGI